MQKEINFDDGSSEYHVKEYKSSTLDALWDKWIGGPGKPQKGVETWKRKNI